jgi:twitching motility protein PilI
MEAGKKRGKLREFSTQLAERLKAAPTLAADPTRLAVRIGADGFLIDMAHAGEILPLTEIAPVPWTRPWFRGLANVRGRLVGVVDLMQFTGRAPLPAEHAKQLLVFGDATKVNAAVLITRAFGIRVLKDLEPLGPAAQAWEVARYRDLDGTVLTELNLGALAASEEFATVGV